MECANVCPANLYYKLAETNMSRIIFRFMIKF